MIKMKGLRHREGQHYSEVVMGKHHKNHKDAGGSVPPAGPYKNGGSVPCRATGGRVEGTPSRTMDRGQSIGQRSGSNPSHELDHGKEVGRRATGGPIKRAMGGVGKERHDEVKKRSLGGTLRSWQLP